MTTSVKRDLNVQAEARSSRKWTQPLSPTLHGLGDYLAALALIVAPLVLPLGHSNPIASSLTVVAGISLIAYSLLTSYKFGAIKVLSYRAHLVFDTVAAAAIAVAPFLLGFKGIDFVFYEAVALSLGVVISLSRSE